MKSSFENYNLDPNDLNYGNEMREKFRISSRNSALMKVLHPQVVPQNIDPLFPVFIAEETFLPIVSEDVKMIVKDEEQRL